MFLGDCLRNGKAQAVMLALAAAGFVHPVEAIEEVRNLFRRDLVALVDHSQNGLMPLTFQ